MAGELPFDELPAVAAAIHNGHELRPDIASRMQLNAATRRREEDPYTARWTAACPWGIVATRSRFEVDLNRPRDKAVYRAPADCWNLDLWREPLPLEAVRESLALYDEFYAAVQSFFQDLLARCPRLVVLDLHTYNHQRDGRGAGYADPAANPEVNLGTGTMNRTYWAPVVETFLGELRKRRDLGRPLDVRENVRFQGGEFGRWIHRKFPHAICCLSIEVKKFFMDEWTGIGEQRQIAGIGRALRGVVPAVTAALSEVASPPAGESAPPLDRGSPVKDGIA